MTKSQFNRIIAAAQWSSSWFIASAFLLVLLNVSLPGWLTGPFVVGIAVLAPLFLTIGMYQCWKLPDDRKWLAVPASLFLILSGVMMFSTVVERDRKRATAQTLDAVHSSVAWKVAQGEFDAAMKAYNILADRVFPAEFAKRFKENEDAKTAQWAIVQEKSGALKKLEPKVNIEESGLFDVLGKEWSWAVQSIFLALYAVVNEAIALSLAYRPKETAQSDAKTEKTERTAKAEPFGVDEYIEWARKLGKDGLLAGYRMVSEATGQSTYRCRELFAEALETGKIRKRPGERNVREESA